MSRSGFEAVLQALQNLGTVGQGIGDRARAKRQQEAENKLREDDQAIRKDNQLAEKEYRAAAQEIQKQQLALQQSAEATRRYNTEYSSILNSVSEVNRLIADPTSLLGDAEKQLLKDNLQKRVESSVKKLGFKPGSGDAMFFQSLNPWYQPPQPKQAAGPLDAVLPPSQESPAVSEAGYPVGSVRDNAFGTGFQTMGKGLGDLAAEYSPQPVLDLFSRTPASAMQAAEFANKMVPKNLSHVGMLAAGAGIGGALAPLALPAGLAATPAATAFAPSIAPTIGAGLGIGAGAIAPQATPSILDWLYKQW